MTVQELPLHRIKELNWQRATTLSLRLEVRKKTFKTSKKFKYKIQSAFDIYELVKSELPILNKNFVVICLNVKVK